LDFYWHSSDIFSHEVLGVVFPQIIIHGIEFRIRHFMNSQSQLSHHSRAGDAHESQRRNHHEQPRTNKTDADNRLEASVVLAESSAAGV
jgi:hypothetical protein